MPQGIHHVQLLYANKKLKQTGWVPPVLILATWEAEIRRLQFEANPGK
jgi:hypothetical protein